MEQDSSQQEALEPVANDNRHTLSARLPLTQQATLFSRPLPSARLGYRHLNLPGQYDFSDQPLPAKASFDINQVAAWQC